MIISKIKAPMKIIFIDFLRDIAYFPFWWYSKGAKKALFFSLRKIKNAEKRLGLKIWLVNLFRPMFGQYDMAGKIISFFIRLIQIIVRSILMLIWIILMIILFFVWLLLPLFIIYQIIINLK